MTQKGLRTEMSDKAWSAVEDRLLTIQIKTNREPDLHEITQDVLRELVYGGATKIEVVTVTSTFLNEQPEIPF